MKKDLVVINFFPFLLKGIFKLIGYYWAWKCFQMLGNNQCQLLRKLIHHNFFLLNKRNISIDKEQENMWHNFSGNSIFSPIYIMRKSLCDANNANQSVQVCVCACGRWSSSLHQTRSSTLFVKAWSGNTTRGTDSIQSDWQQSRTINNNNTY